MRRRIITSCILTALLCACGTELEPAPAGGVVSGTLRYDGAAHFAFERPAITVALFASFPPEGIPHGTVQYENPDTLAPIPYELDYVQAFDYFLIAQIIDVNAPIDPDALPTGPVGAFPNTCALFASETGPVPVSMDAPTEGIDVVLYDNGGLDDPCGAPPPEVCPETDASSVSITISSDVGPTEIGANDQIVWGLFEAWPPVAPPSTFGVVAASDISFPEQVSSTSVTPGDYALYVCFDRGGDNLTTTCGDEDDFVVFESGALQTFDANTIHAYEVDLSAGTAVATPPQSPADAGCE